MAQEKAYAAITARPPDPPAEAVAMFGCRRYLLILWYVVPEPNYGIVM